MKILSEEQILFLHGDLIKNFGGTECVRDENLLKSAIFAPFQTFDGSELYPTVLEKAARLGFGLIKNHPFIDGNKRTGTHAMLVFLKINGIKIEYDDENLIEIIFRLAEDTFGYNDLLEWFQNHSADKKIIEFDEGG